VSRNVIVVGGGIAGLAASIYLARGGRTVTLFERRANLGGRAITHLRHGFRFNLGPHAFYPGGAGAQVLRELGVPVVGGKPDGSGIALLGNERYRFPGGAMSLLTTGLIPFSAKAEAAKLFLRIRKYDDKSDLTVRQWLDREVSNDRLRQVVEAMIRLATYSDHPDEQSADVALRQLRSATRRGVIYVDEGWQKIVDSLHSSAVIAGVNFVTSAPIVGVEHDDAVRAIELGGLEEEARMNDTVAVNTPVPIPSERGTRLKADEVVLAVDPGTARDLAPNLALPAMRPVTAACLDVALTKLPEPKTHFALGIDHPTYFSVHSRWAQLTPRGGALIHVAKYRKSRSGTEEQLESTGERRTPTAAADEQELEMMLDDLQPGWRDVIAHRRFLPAMTVANALARPSQPRPGAVTPVKGLYVAGDWVGDEGILSDAALASARAAARAILSV
jgi:phytoene dehydrogenase-like protein